MALWMLGLGQGISGFTVSAGLVLTQLCPSDPHSCTFLFRLWLHMFCDHNLIILNPQFHDVIALIVVLPNSSNGEDIYLAVVLRVQMR